MHPDYINHPGHADHDPSLDINFQPKATMPAHPTNRNSGGEFRESAAAQSLRKLIQGEFDVRRIVHLAERANGKFLYMIETPFQTFPRFVIGTTNADNSEVHHIFKSGSEWSAQKTWEELRHVADPLSPHTTIG
jgi:hypothetical protein